MGQPFRNTTNANEDVLLIHPGWFRNEPDVALVLSDGIEFRPQGKVRLPERDGARSVSRYSCPEWTAHRMTLSIQQLVNSAASGAIAAQYSDIGIERVNGSSHPAPQLLESVGPAALFENGCFKRQRKAVAPPASLRFAHPN